MGGGGSSTINQEFNMSVVNDVMYNSVTNNDSINENTMQNIQGMELNILKSVGCNITTSQEITSSFMATTEQITESFQSVENDIVNELQAQAGAALDKQTQMGNMQFGDRQNVNQTINTEIENIVKTNLETNNLTKTINEAVNIQDQTINIGEVYCFNGETLTFKQNISADLAAQAVAKNLLSAITTNKTTNEIITKGETSLASKAGGTAEAIESAGEAVTGVVGAVTSPMRSAIIGAVLSCIVVIIAMVMIARSPAVQKKIKNASFPTV
jgi:hypothetical protein